MDSIELNKKDFDSNVLRATLIHFTGHQVRLVTRSNIIFEGTYVNMNTKNQICMRNAYQVDDHNPLEEGIRVNTLMISVSTLKSIHPTDNNLCINKRLYGVRLAGSPPISFDRKEKKNDVTENNIWYDKKSQQNDTSQHMQATLPSPENDLVFDHLSPRSCLQLQLQNYSKHTFAPIPPHASNVYNAHTNIPSYYGMQQRHMVPNFVPPYLQMPAIPLQNMQQRPMHDPNLNVDPYFSSLLYHNNNQMSQLLADKTMQYAADKPAYEPPQPQAQPQQQRYYPTQGTSAPHAGHAAVSGIATGFQPDFARNFGHTHPTNNDEPRFENRLMYKSPPEVLKPEWQKLRQIWANKDIEEYRMSYNARTYKMINSQNIVPTENKALGAAAEPKPINQTMPVNKHLPARDISDYKNILTSDLKDLNFSGNTELAEKTVLATETPPERDNKK